MADFAICAVKPIPTKQYCSPIKTGEYWAMGLPIVIPSNIGEDSEIIKKENIGFVLSRLNNDEYQKAIKEIENLLSESTNVKLKEKICEIAWCYRSENSIKPIYESIYQNAYF